MITDEEMLSILYSLGLPMSLRDGERSYFDKLKSLYQLGRQQFTGKLITANLGCTAAEWYAIGKANFVPSALQFAPNNELVLRIEADGRVWWKDRYVEGDEEFKQAMMDLNKKLGVVRV